MTEFASLDSYERFEESVMAKATVVGERPWLSHGELDAEAKEFVRIVLETSVSRKKKLSKDSHLYRAQVAFDVAELPLRIRTAESDDEVDEIIGVPTEIECRAERMLPDADKVRDGRANQKGTPYLYLATNPQTALAEMRPWVGSLITLAQFVVTRACQVVYCFSDMWPSWSHREDDRPPDAETKAVGVWSDIGIAFSKPVASDEITEYVPTQVLAAAFRDHGYDGIAYKSLLADRESWNVVLFDVGVAKPLPNRCLYRTEAVSYEFGRLNDVDQSWPLSTHARYCDQRIVPRRARLK